MAISMNSREASTPTPSPLPLSRPTFGRCPARERSGQIAPVLRIGRALRRVAWKRLSASRPARSTRRWPLDSLTRESNGARDFRQNTATPDTRRQTLHKSRRRSAAATTGPPGRAPYGSPRTRPGQAVESAGEPQSATSRECSRHTPCADRSVLDANCPADRSAHGVCRLHQCDVCPRVNKSRQWPTNSSSAGATASSRGSGRARSTTFSGRGAPSARRVPHDRRSPTAARGGSCNSCGANPEAETGESAILFDDPPQDAGADQQRGRIGRAHRALQLGKRQPPARADAGRLGQDRLSAGQIAHAGILSHIHRRVPRRAGL